MKIYVDADACPVVIKDIIFRAAERKQITTLLVANQLIRVPPSRFISAITVASGFDEADNEIVRRCEAGDLVITADIPLAADVLGLAAVRMKSSGELAILFTNDAEMRLLNSQWRGLDKPTDVLSFPGEGPEIPGQPQYLGDIAIGYDTALRDAEAMGRSFEAHIAHLLIHGFLHLLGYDHIEDADAAVMEGCEVRILASLGLSDPYS